jgi:hypothetical protein
MSKKSQRTFKRNETQHVDCACCEHAAERIEELRQSLLGGIHLARTSSPMMLWADANERLLARKRFPVFGNSAGKSGRPLVVSSEGSAATEPAEASE